MSLEWSIKAHELIITGDYSANLLVSWLFENMKVQNMQSPNGREVPNQFIISERGNGANGNFIEKEVFQSYKSVIVERIIWDDRVDITLDEYYWDYSTTTGKYRNMFLGEDKNETKKKIASGEYKLANLN